MCPWHGACFRVDSGDIEDAPAIDSLQSFPVTVKGGKVFIEAEELLVKLGKRMPTCSKIATSSTLIAIVIGGGSGGLVACETLRAVC